MKQTVSGEVTHSFLDHGTGIPKGATKPHRLPGEAQVTILTPQLRLGPGGTSKLLQLRKASSKRPWLLQIPARKRNCGTKWAELEAKGGKEKTTPNSSNHLSNQPWLFSLLAHHVVHSIFTE